MYNFRRGCGSRLIVQMSTGKRRTRDRSPVYR